MSRNTSQGLPRLDDAVGWAVCDLWEVVEGGDHLLLVGLVTLAETTRRPPMACGQRTFGTDSRFGDRPRPPIADVLAACAR